MTCEECREILLDSDKCASRKSWMPGVSVLSLAKLHTENCSACANSMSEISKMNDALDQLRSSTKQMEAPATIETNLLVEFRRRALPARSVPITFRRRLLWGSALVLALAAGLISYSALRARSLMTVQALRTERPAQQPPAPLYSGASPDRAPIENQQPGTDRAPSASSKLERRTRPTIPARKESSLPVPVNPAPVNDELSLNGGGSVVRVILPLASLVAMGVPMYPEMSGRGITADVARDPFGAVIAIHLVETRPITN
jgi:hypothetical protein